MYTLTLLVQLISNGFCLTQCDGQYIPLPSLQGIAVLNIPSYAGGTNFWGGTKEDDVSIYHMFNLKSLYVTGMRADPGTVQNFIANVQESKLTAIRKPCWKVRFKF